MKKQQKFWIRLAGLAGLAIIASGCETFDPPQSHEANSLYNYLYFKERGHRDVETVPVLSLPLRVGIAFVPVDQPTNHDSCFAPDDGRFPEGEKMKLMKQISGEFTRYPFVKSIETIPSVYLTARGGFANLDQIQELYGVDVMVLLSYDQVQFTDQGFLSLSYLTIVGSFVIRGDKNDTQTMLDGAVYDIASRKLLFRAPGLSTVKGSATPVNLSEQLRRDSETGFKMAATNMVSGLKVQLDAFRERVKSAPDEFKVVNKPGYTGGSALGGMELILACGLGVYFWRFRSE